MKKSLVCTLMSLVLLALCVSTAAAVKSDYVWSPDYNSYDEVMPPMDNTPIRFYVVDNHDGTWDLQLTIKNLSLYNWGSNQVDLVCTKGMKYLNNPEEIRWNISDAVNRGETTQMTLKLGSYVKGANFRFNVKYGDTYLMGFYIKL